MKGSQSASARFAALVKAAGQPQVVTLWTRPEEDREFMEAVRTHRVLTVRQENTGTRKDHGEVGFVREGSNVYLVFPKSIEDFEGKRVVGIQYDLLGEAKPRGAAVVASARRERKNAPAARKKEPPAPKPEPHFAVEVQRTVAVTTTLEVTAKTAASARKMALEQAEDTPLDFSGAAVRTRIVSARKMKNQ